MNNLAKTGALAVVAAVAAGVVGVELANRARPGSPGIELKSKLPKRLNVSACPPITLICEHFEEGAGYHRKTINANDCREQEHGFVVAARNGWRAAESSCRPASVGSGAGVELPLECACHGKGSCVYPTDGGTTEAPIGRTLGPGYPPYESFSGEGCVPKACTELMGHTSWPAGCERLKPKRGK